MSLLQVILGRRLANRDSSGRKIGAFEGIPAMGLDGLGSSSYGPEAALTVLMPLGAASLYYVGWVIAPIIALLLILFASYWQTIRAYPNNGGAYIVAKTNLGTNAGLLASSALMIDYVLNVAVGISAGVGALVSAIPALHPHILPLCLGILAFITIVNLRGTLDAGRLFALPTYLFVASFLGILAIGIYIAIQAGGEPAPVIAPPPQPGATEAVSIWLLLRAFAAGCTAMTGVEAVSNGVTAFRDPTVKYGHRTLTGIVLVLGTLLGGVAYLSTVYGISAMDQTMEGYQSVMSQLAHAVVGDGPAYYVAIGSLLCVLTLSANTSFVDFPRLCRMVAADGFLPKPFAVSGRRLVFSVGILYLAATAALLLIVFGGITDRLIPLFAIGAFLTFTLSQTGMVIHWLRLRQHASKRRPTHAIGLWINSLGAVVTAIALGVIMIAKFEEGAWITLLVIPCVVVLLKLIRAYYDDLELGIRDAAPLKLDDVTPPVILIAVEDWNKLTDRALEFALSISPDIIAIHLTQLSGPDAEEHSRQLRTQWEIDVEAPAREAGLTPPRLMFLEAQRRAIGEPILKLIQELENKFGSRRMAVLIPEIIKERWYQNFLHTHRARGLRKQLLRHGNDRLTVINVPWYLSETQAS